jgi:hypothetical protein
MYSPSSKGFIKIQTPFFRIGQNPFLAFVVNPI